ncbi:hypothetical protein NXT3_PB00317 (plasmid) [Sinorhizobium fredii]|uniref:Uncharacterized protein n=1 Tax=Rhizobium fredii TaxID=380 RepID=A0A2L0HBV9_RHIFR|nr:hypothetical protein NXT3_PB00317 [Sinorhizobium fredii]
MRRQRPTVRRSSSTLRMIVVVIQVTLLWASVWKTPSDRESAVGAVTQPHHGKAAVIFITPR